MSHYGNQFEHKQLVQVKIYGQTVALYPALNATMSAAERAHGFHVTQNNLTAVSLTPRQLLNALGQQTGQSTVVDGEIAGVLRHFDDHWRNFRNLTILSWHNSTGAMLNNTTVPGDSSVLLPIQNGLVADCRQQDVMFVRVQISVDYSYCIRGIQPLRLDFYVELPQTSTPMVNGANQAYNLVTYAGPADIRTLDTQQAAGAILNQTYQAAPGQLTAATFGTTSATLNQDAKMAEIESRILRVTMPAISKAMFLAVAPGYTDQPKAALEHVYQVATDAEGVRACRSVQDYYSQLMGAMQPFIQMRQFPVNAAEKFKQHISSDLFPFFKQAYPTHSSVVPLDAQSQLAALRSMLTAAQIGEDNQKLISKTAANTINAQSFMASTGTAVNVSQAEKTMTAYKNRKDPLCFGCGGAHYWSKRQDDGTYTILCPNKDKTGVQAAATAKIADIRSKRKDRKESFRKSKKSRTTVNAAFDSLSNEQKALCIEEATRRAAANSAVAKQDKSSTRTVFVVTHVVVNSAEPHLPILPISIQSNMPHILLQLGPSVDTADCPDIRCAVDTCAGLCTGNYTYLMALARRYPHCLYRLFTAKEYSPIILSGIVQNGDASAVTTALDCMFQFHIPYKLRGDGGDCVFSIAAGRDVSVNVILGLPFIISMKMVCDFVDNLATCHAINAPSFPIDYRRTCNTVPKPDAGASLVEHSVLRELDDYERWRNSRLVQPEVAHLQGTKRVTFGVPIDVDLCDPAEDHRSDSMSHDYTNVPRVDGTM